MGNGWFETVAEAERRAHRRLPKSVYWAVVAGSEQGATLADNVAAFRELGQPRTRRGCPRGGTCLSRCWASRCRCR
jgi:hypothetical protein